MIKKLWVVVVTISLLLSGMLVAVGGEAAYGEEFSSEPKDEDDVSGRDSGEKNPEISQGEDSEGLDSEALEKSNYEITGSSGPYAKEGLLILRPIISVPEIVESGDTMEVWVRHSEGDANEDNWEAALAGDQIHDLTVTNVNSGENWEGDPTWRLTVNIDNDADDDLYNLNVVYDDGTEHDSDWSEDAVDVVSEIDDEFTFVHASDTHFGWRPSKKQIFLRPPPLPPKIRVVPNEQKPTARESLNQFIDQMNDEQPDFIILTGDVSNKEPNFWGVPDEPSPEVQDQYFRNELLDLEVPIYVGHGNHDYSYDDSDDLEQNIESYRNHLNPHLTYTFNYGEDYHFIMQDSGKYRHIADPLAKGVLSMEDVIWMDNLLDENQDKTMQFVGMHHPARPDRIYEGFKRPDYPPVREDFLDSIEKHDVDAVFAGHTHDSEIRDAYGDDVSDDHTEGYEPLHVTTGDIAKGNWEFREINIQDDEVESMEIVNLWEPREDELEIVDQAVSPHSVEPGETLEIQYKIENPHDEDKYIGLGATIGLPTAYLDEEQEEWWHSDPDNDKIVKIAADETETRYREFEIPESAPAGPYDVAFGLWDGQPGDSEPLQISMEEEILEVEEDASIRAPTESTPALVGDPENPVFFDASIFVNSPTELDKESFEVEIGGEPAEIVLVDAPINHFQGNYQLLINPPEKNIDREEEEYDLQVVVNKDEFEAEDLVENAVLYSEGGNVDVPQVIDRSGSMSGEPIEDAREASKDFVDMMNEGDGVGVISYATDSRVDFELTEITDENIKEETKNIISDIDASGTTDITDGLTDAYHELEERGLSGNNKAILHMTDGVHNQGPDPIEDSIVEQLAEKGYPVYNVGLYDSELDEELLTEISEKTGGKYYYAAESEDLIEIYNMIAGEIRNEMTLERVDGEMYDEGETEEHQVFVDETVHSSIFSVTWTDGEFDLTVINPEGDEIDASEEDVIHTEGDYRELFEVENPDPGEWTMEVTVLETNSPTSYTASATAQTDLTMNTDLDKPNYNMNEPMRIRTILSDGGDPITDADVTANIEGPDGSIDSIQLHDHGVHGDGDASNGIYANYYERTEFSGSYTISVEASGRLDQEKFARKTTESFYVKEEAVGISSTADVINLELGTGESIMGNFEVFSNTDNTETFKSSVPGLINEEYRIEGTNIDFYPSTSQIPANENIPLYFNVDIPEEAEPGVYDGEIILETTVNNLKIPLSVTVPVTTRRPSEVTENSAKLNSEFILADRDSVDMYFQFGEEDENEWEITEKITYDMSGSHQENLPGLDPATTYKYRAVYENQNSTLLIGDTQNFTTEELETEELDEYPDFLSDYWWLIIPGVMGIVIAIGIAIARKKNNSGTQQPSQQQTFEQKKPVQPQQERQPPPPKDGEDKSPRDEL